MIQVICDKCGEDCGLNAFALTVEVINNPCPVHIFDVGDLKITCDHTKMRMIVCQSCYRSFGFPNIHKAVREKKLTWRDTPKTEEMRKDCSNCANHDKSGEIPRDCNICVSARLPNGDMTEPSHWKPKTQKPAEGDA